MNKTGKTIAIVLMIAFSTIYFIKSTPGLGKPWNPHAPSYDSVKYLEGMWLCWIPTIHCIPVPMNK